MRFETKAYGSMSTHSSLDNGEETSETASGERNRLIGFKEKHLSMEDPYLNFPRRSVASRCIAVCLLAAFLLLVGFSNRSRIRDTFHFVDPRNHDASGHEGNVRPPFSTLDPVADLGLEAFHRPKSSGVPPPLHSLNSSAYPTNSWYQNLLMPWEEPQSIHNAYAIPYIVDASGPFPGLRIHPTHVGASSSVVQLDIVEEFAVTLGAAEEETDHTHTYRVTHVTPLGVTLEWNAFPMHSTITQGMPYATMVYDRIEQDGRHGQVALPTIGSEVPLAADPIIDGTRSRVCDSDHPEAFLVEREVELLFDRSDFSWLVFFSEPVMVRCVDSKDKGLRLQVTEWKHEKQQDRDLVIRVALSKLCSTGISPIYCHQERMHPTALNLGQGHYDDLLRKFASLFPGPGTDLDYVFNENGTIATVTFDWDAQNMSAMALRPIPVPRNWSDVGLLTYALPHHFDLISQHPPGDHDMYCVSTLVGPACLYEGITWDLVHEIPRIGFRAERPPAPWSVVSIGKSLLDDIKYRLPDFYQRGAGDTYFSGKMIAKLARILLIYEEMKEICSASHHLSSKYEEACQNVTLPSETMFFDGLNSLRSSVEIWINGTAETPFVYDPTWGGVVSCGCLFDDKHGICKNAYPDCPGFDDPGLNFGNAFYNDCHFHYGYMIFGSAVVAHFDHDWARRNTERVLLLIRTIANPSKEEDHFPLWRHKDWYSSHSWASGIAAVFRNGKNQESSSEAIAAWEAVALFGTAMREVHGKSDNVARSVEQAGQLLAATELRGTQFYWHPEINRKVKIFPSEYTTHTVGMLWQTMAQAQTWFGNAPYLAYGIQLLPLTPIAEHRDTLTWAKSMYQAFGPSCSENPACEEDGWSILQLAILATVGHPRIASNLLEALPAAVFLSAGGDGHSLTNSLWFCATRPPVEIALELEEGGSSSSSGPIVLEQKVFDCGNPKYCTDFVLDTIAGLYSCRQRMEWLMLEYGKNETEACGQVANIEHTHECGPCDPENQSTTVPKATCAPCTPDQCNSDLNRCPRFESTFVCTEGMSKGGCSRNPWEVPSVQCGNCCELSDCPKSHGS